MLACITAMCFTAAHTLWTIQLSQKREPVNQNEKLHAILFTVAFLLGIFLSIYRQEIAATVSFMVGFVVSEFSIAIAFYDKLKEVEIPCE